MALKALTKEQADKLRNEPPNMMVRWVEVDYFKELEERLNPLAMINVYGQKNYYKLQQYFDGKWCDIEVSYPY